MSKRVLITGGNSGIGFCTAEQLASRGAEVILACRDQTKGQAAVARIKGSHPQARVRLFPLDLSDLSQVRGCARRLNDELDGIDVLINNAGVVFGGEFEQVDLQRHLDTFKVNSEGLMACTHAFMDDLIAAPRAHVVNIASASAFIGLPYGSTYAASKWAVVGFSESIRLELDVRKIKHVHVTTVCPSYISTGMFDVVKTPMFTPMLTPGKVVSSIIKGMQKKDSFVIEPPIAKSTELLKAVLPQGVWDEVALRMGVSTSMYSWKGKK